MTEFDFSNMVYHKKTFQTYYFPLNDAELQRRRKYGKLGKVYSSQDNVRYEQ